MNDREVSTRRSFFVKAGAAAVSAPLAVGAGKAAGSDGDSDTTAARLADLEAVDAIRALNRAYAAHVNAGAADELAALFADPVGGAGEPDVAGIAFDRYGDEDVITLAADRASATARVLCTVQIEAEIDGPRTLVEMARLVGADVRRSTEKRVLEGAYVRRHGVWRIERAVLRRV